MDHDKEIIEKRSSFKGWKERNRGKSQQRRYIIGIAIFVLISSTLIVYTYLYGKETNSIPAANASSSNVSNNSPLIKATPNITTPKITPAGTPLITGNIIGNITKPFVINGFEINVTKVTASDLYINVWIIAKNTENTEKPFKIGPSTVVIDNIGLQYERVQVKRSAEIVQTNISAKALREGAIFFDPLREGRSPKKLILEINGKKAEIMLEK